MTDELSKDDVLAWLRAHPELVAELVPPPEDRDETVVDFQRHVIAHLQAALHARTADHENLVDASRGNLASQQQVHDAVLAVLAPRSLEDLVRVISHELPDHLRVDVVLLCFEERARSAIDPADGVTFLSPAFLSGLLDSGQDVGLRVSDGAPAEIFGPAAELIQSQAAATLHLGGDEGAPRAMIVLGDRDPETFEPGQGTQLLRFLADVLSLRLAELLARTDDGVVADLDTARWSRPDS